MSKQILKQYNLLSTTNKTRLHYLRRSKLIQELKDYCTHKVGFNAVEYSVKGWCAVNNQVVHLKNYADSII